MKMHPVKSSKIDVICYDEQTHKLQVSFRKEKPRDFCHVPPCVRIVVASNFKKKIKFEIRHEKI